MTLPSMASQNNTRASSTVDEFVTPTSMPSSPAFRMEISDQDSATSPSVPQKHYKRRTWRGGMTNQSKDTAPKVYEERLISSLQSKSSIPKSTFDDSPTDPAYDPSTRKLVAFEPDVNGDRLEHSGNVSETICNQESVDIDEDSHSLPGMAITGPDEPRSFFDFDSDSSSETDIVIHRASSVRVGKPTIIDYEKITSNHSLRRSKNLPTVSESAFSSSPPIQEMDDTSERHSIIPGGPEDALRILEANATGHASTIGLPPTPSGRQDQAADSEKKAFEPRPTTTEDALASASMTTPVQSLFSFRDSESTRIDSLGTIQSPLDGLRSNPLSQIERLSVSRTISAPPIPRRHVNRRVMIQPLTVAELHAKDDNHWFRDFVVSTPYPKVEDLKDPKDDFSSGNNKPLKPLLHLISDNTKEQKEKDPFPSPTNTEILFLELCLFRHPSARIIIELEISDRSTYDDEVMFTEIRKAYQTRLLGLARLMTARRLTHSTSGDVDIPFDGINFVQYLRETKLGHKRKAWLIWLRNQQPLPKRTTSNVWSKNFDEQGSSIFHSPTSIPRMPFIKQDLKHMPPKIFLHHEFSTFKILFSVFTTIFFSLISTVLWILFGFPGNKVGENIEMREINWKNDDVEKRILIGFVLGLLVLLLGGMSNLAWIAVSWILL